MEVTTISCPIDVRYDRVNLASNEFRQEFAEAVIRSKKSVGVIFVPKYWLPPQTWATDLDTATKLLKLFGNPEGTEAAAQRFQGVDTDNYISVLIIQPDHPDVETYEVSAFCVGRKHDTPPPPYFMGDNVEVVNKPKFTHDPTGIKVFTDDHGHVILNEDIRKQIMELLAKDWPKYKVAFIFAGADLDSRGVMLLTEVGLRSIVEDMFPDPDSQPRQDIEEIMNNFNFLSKNVALCICVSHPHNNLCIDTYDITLTAA